MAKQFGSFKATGGYFPGLQLTSGDTIDASQGKEPETVAINDPCGCFKTEIPWTEFKEMVDQDMLIRVSN